MKPTELSSKTFPSLNEGRAGQAFDELLAQAVADLEAHGDDGKARVVNVALEMKRDGDQVAVVVKVGAKIPGQKTSVHMAKVRKLRGKTILVFSPDDESNPDQAGLFDQDQQ